MVKAIFPMYRASGLDRTQGGCAVQGPASGRGPDLHVQVPQQPSTGGQAASGTQRTDLRTPPKVWLAETENKLEPAASYVGNIRSIMRISTVRRLLNSLMIGSKATRQRRWCLRSSMNPPSPNPMPLMVAPSWTKVACR